MSVRSDDWPRVKEIFEAVRELPLDARHAELAERCGSDAALRAEIESLLTSHDQADDFLETPAGVVFDGLAGVTLLEGRKIGPYQIKSAIGAGGMGEVYRAVDTRLDRSVAIKVLSLNVAGDPQARDRFAREARAVAALNHPHICTLHDIGHEGGIDFLVMEYLEGETLAARLERGPLPVDQALDYAIQLASALDKAHRAGIVHRDLKPGNVMLTKAGTKLLDFGLAKAPAPILSTEHGPGGDLTGAGVILGTARYMAPEQLEGKSTDARTDLFTFGAVLYEMLSGRRAFDAPSHARLIAAIVSEQPPALTTFRAGVPPALDYIVSRCLEKDPDDRWQTARDLLAELTRTKESLGRSTGLTTFAVARPRLRWLIPALTVVAVAPAAFTGLTMSRAPSADSAMWLSILPPPDGFDLSPDPAVSPDGRYVAYKAQDASHRTRIWLKDLQSASAAPIRGTEGTDYTGAHFWSPDSRSLAFFAQGKLKRIDIDGAALQVLAPAPEPRGGTWSTSGVIVFNADTRNLMRVAASGGAPSNVTDASGGVRLFPYALPDGRRYLFTSRDAHGQGQGIYVGSLDSPEVRRISDAWSPGAYAQGNLLFVRQRALFVQSFDPDSSSVSGEPRLVADGVGVGYGTPLSFSFSVSPAGVLTYWSGSARAGTELTWFDRHGARVSVAGEAGVHTGFTMSKDGRRAAVERHDLSTGTTDLWLVDPSSRAGASRLTNDGRLSVPALSPNGDRLVLMERGRGLSIMPTSNAKASPIVEDASSKWPTDWSLDGRLIAFTDSTPTGWRLWTIPAEPAAKPTLYREAPFALASMQFSPDGRWVAYTSDESGQAEVYVDAYPADHRVRVSVAGGGWPKWRRDGTELYYLAPDRKLMMVAVQNDHNGLSFTPPVALFEGPGINPDSSRTQFEPSADGSRFLFNARIEDHTPVGLTVISNWPALVR